MAAIVASASRYLPFHQGDSEARQLGTGEKMSSHSQDEWTFVSSLWRTGEDRTRGGDKRGVLGNNEAKRKQKDGNKRGSVPPWRQSTAGEAHQSHSVGI